VGVSYLDSLLTGLSKNYSTFIKSGGLMAHRPRKTLDFGGNPDHVRLGLGLG